MDPTQLRYSPDSRMGASRRRRRDRRHLPVRRRSAHRPDHDRAARGRHPADGRARASARSRASRRSATSTPRSAARSSRSTPPSPTNVQLLAEDPYDKGWLIKVKVDDPADDRRAAGPRRLREEGGRRRPLTQSTGSSDVRSPASAATPAIVRVMPVATGSERDHMAYIANTPDDVRVMLGDDRARLARPALRHDPAGVPAQAAAGRSRRR